LSRHLKAEVNNRGRGDFLLAKLVIELMEREGVGGEELDQVLPEGEAGLVVACANTKSIDEY
jgi:hypothetical protein